MSLEYGKDFASIVYAENTMVMGRMKKVLQFEKSFNKLCKNK